MITLIIILATVITISLSLIIWTILTCHDVMCDRFGIIFSDKEDDKCPKCNGILY